MPEADLQARDAEVREPLDVGGVPLADEDHHPIGGDSRPRLEALAHDVEEGLIAGEVGVRRRPRVHLCDEDPAAVVDAGDAHSLALLKGADGVVDRGVQHPAAEEQELWPLLPEVAVHGLIAHLFEEGEPSVPRGEEAAKAQRSGRLLGGLEDADRHGLTPARELWQVDALQAIELIDGGVPHQAGVEAPEVQVIGEVHHGGLCDLRRALDALPVSALGES